MESNEALYEDLCDRGTYYLNSCHFPELEEKMDNLDTRWKEVEEEMPNRSDNIRALLTVWQVRRITTIHVLGF